MSVLALGCAPDTSPAGPPPRDAARVDAPFDGGAHACGTTLDEIQTEILVPSCGGMNCHGGATPQLGLDLVSPGLEARLVLAPSASCPRQTLVVPGDPGASFLIEKISSDTPTCGSRMPLGMAFAAEDIACITAWAQNLATTDAGPLPDGGVRDGAIAGDAGFVCSAGLDVCGTACVDTLSDPANCGACGHRCTSRQVCASGACMAGICPLGTTDCNGACVDLTSSPLHCGSCTTACPAGEACTASSCSCSLGDVCGGECVDVASDPLNCGMCDHVCGAGVACMAGACVDCGPASTLSGQVQPIFDAHCGGAACHQSARPAGSLDLSAGASFTALVGAPTSGCSDGRLRVQPSRPDLSYLMDKITGTHLCFGMQMPLTGASLSTSDVDLVRAWICRGALDD